jgi:hypothetical protein
MPLPIYDTSATQATPLGTEYKIGQDRVFRYAKNGLGARAVGTILQGPQSDMTHANMTCAAAAVGKMTVTVTLAQSGPIAKDQYKEGYLYTNDAAGQGYVYEIRDHKHGGDEDDTRDIYLKDRIVVALTTSSEVTLIPNVYRGVNLPGGDPWDIIVGVAPVAVPSEHYFWCQVRGPAAVLQSGGLFQGRGVMLSQRVNGAVEVLKQVIPAPQLSQETVPTALQFTQKGIYTRIDRMGSTATDDDEALINVSGDATIPERCIGYCINPRVSTEHALIYLTLS